MKSFFLLPALIFITISIQSCKNKIITNESNTWIRPVTLPENKEEESDNPDKFASWTPEQSARHQEKLAKLPKISRQKNDNIASVRSEYADGALNGTWVNRGPKNMPGAFKFAEMLDNTDIIYGVTWNHYVGEYNSTSYIHKGTIYNPATGTGGDDFELLTANWPNRYQNLFAFEINGTVRLVAHIESGPVYFSDDDGQNWTLATGLPAANFSSTINRQDDNKIYVSNNNAVYVSTNMGESFSLLKNFGSAQNSSLYSPRYELQAGAANIYLARNGSFYKLNATQTDFEFVGNYVNSHGDNNFSIGGDSNVLYVTENKNYWVSTDEGLSWTQKFPTGNWYGDTSGKMSAGKFIAAHPEDANIVIGGYAHPVVSTDALTTNWTDETGWGIYQLGSQLPLQEYQNVIRFNYHPDFQSSHFFYNSTGDIFSARCSDGGIFISYKEWTDLPSPGEGYNFSGYANAHFININVLNTITSLIYRDALFTGANNPDHIYYGTQDQGSQNIIQGSSGDQLDFYQTIGGDGPSIDSYDGLNAWKWHRQGEKVWAPGPVYNNGNFRSIGDINQQINSQPFVEFSNQSDMGWVQTYIDRHDPAENIWMLSKQLHRAKWNGNTLLGHTVDKGNRQIAALAQGTVNPDLLYMLQDGKVFISYDRGNTFGQGINTPFITTPNGGWTTGDIGSGVVLPGNDDWILFSGPSSNAVGSILSTDGGATWTDVTGIYPSGIDAQTGGMIVTPNGEFVFAGTDVGGYVYDVEQSEWFSLAEDIGFFNVVDLDYIQETNTVRFATFGSGILDFNIENGIISNASQLPESEQVLVYPNPTKDYVNIEITSDKISNMLIEIIDLKGQILSSQSYAIEDVGPIKLNIASMSSGIYLIKLTDQHEKSQTKKLVIQ